MVGEVAGGIGIIPRVGVGGMLERECAVEVLLFERWLAFEKVGGSSNGVSFFFLLFGRDVLMDVCI